MISSHASCRQLGLINLLCLICMVFGLVESIAHSNFNAYWGCFVLMGVVRAHSVGRIINLDCLLAPLCS